MKIKVYTILLVIVVLFMMFITYNYFFVYHISINGNENMILNVNSKYKELGATIKYRGKVLKDYVIENNIDNKNIGNYFVKYKIGNSFNYIEPGFVAIDNNDGDITKKVSVNGKVNKVELGEYDIIYKVKDSSNNETEIVRVVSVVDREKPKIEFSRNLNTYAIKGEKIDLNDFKATDNYDGDITKNVKVTGNVDFDKDKIIFIKIYPKNSIPGNKTEVK